MTQKHTIYSSGMKLWAKMSEINLQFIFFLLKRPWGNWKGPQESQVFALRRRGIRSG